MERKVALQVEVNGKIYSTKPVFMTSEEVIILTKTVESLVKGGKSSFNLEGVDNNIHYFSKEVLKNSVISITFHS